MNIKEALYYSKQNLHAHLKKHASFLLSSYINKPYHWMLIHEDEEVLGLEGFKNWIKKANEFEPLEYITQKVCFYSKDFFIKKGVLIPRPETEILVEKACKIIKQNDTVLEIGVGSGVISIMLALMCKNIKIIATDVNDVALDVAKMNAKKFDVLDKIQFLHTSYDENITQKIDVIISNPPYIANDTKLEACVLKEPHNALFGGEIGDEMLKQLVLIAKKRKVRYLLCEMGYDQKKSMEKFLKQNNINKYEFYKDLSNLDRGFIAKIK